MLLLCKPCHVILMVDEQQGHKQPRSQSISPLPSIPFCLACTLQMDKEGKTLAEWGRVTYIYLNVVLTRHSGVLQFLVIIVSLFYFIIIFQCCCALRTQLCREMRRDISLKNRKIARSDQKHPTQSVKSQTRKKASICFVKDLLRYQNTKKKGKSTFMLSIKTATTLFVFS